MRLSVCIATFNRAGFIGETLDAILPQLTPDMEVVVVDGASTDGTAQVMADYASRCPQLAYHRETENGGVDRDFDKAVQYARGDYCWLMGDDDIVVPGALQQVLEAVADDPALVVVNAEVRDKEMGTVLKPGLLPFTSDRSYGPDDGEALFGDVGSYLSYIGGVVVRREAWLRRDRAAYFGSLFIHMGVIFQQPALLPARALARTLVRIRWGNAQWSARAFEIWMFKWPDLVWSFGSFSDAAKERVTPQHPARSLRTMLWYRGIGVYGPKEAKRLGQLPSGQRHPFVGLVSRLPVRLLNAALALYCALSRHGDARMKLYDLRRAGRA